MGVNRLSGRVMLWPDARFDYSWGQIRRFIKMWEDGEPISKICESFTITQFDAFLLVSWCEFNEWIKERPGGYKGTKKHRWKQKQKAAQ
jgi:hypothetical protein